MRLTSTLAGRVAAKMRSDGFSCTTFDVEEVYEKGYLDDEGQESLASRILQEFEELGIEVPR